MRKMRPVSEKIKLGLTFRNELTKWNSDIENTILSDSDFAINLIGKYMEQVEGNVAIESMIDELGEIETTFLYLKCLTERLYSDPDGGYEWLFNQNYLMTDECQEIEDDEYYDLDILKSFGKKFDDLIHPRKPVFQQHFKNVCIRQDSREYIDKHCDEHEEYCNELSDLLSARGGNLEIEETSLSQIVFLNPRQWEIERENNLDDYDTDLQNLLQDTKLEEIINQIIIDKYSKDIIEIELYLCSPYADNSGWSSRNSHPKREVKNLKRYLSENTLKVTEVYTSLPMIFDYIYNEVRKGHLKIKQDEFIYWDEWGELYKIFIEKDTYSIQNAPESFNELFRSAK